MRCVIYSCPNLVYSSSYLFRFFFFFPPISIAADRRVASLGDPIASLKINKRPRQISGLISVQIKARAFRHTRLVHARAHAHTRKDDFAERSKILAGYRSKK